MPPIKNSVRVRFLIKRKEAICQAFFMKKWGILIKKESEGLLFTDLEIPRDYYGLMEEF